jgi:hypothetical protein
MLHPESAQRTSTLILDYLPSARTTGKVPELRRYSSPELGSWTCSSTASPAQPLVDAISSRTSTKFWSAVRYIIRGGYHGEKRGGRFFHLLFRCERGSIGLVWEVESDLCLMWYFRNPTRDYRREYGNDFV